MKAIKTTATVTADSQITLTLPSTIPAGEYQVVLVIDEQPVTEKLATQEKHPLLNFPVDNYGPWPADLSLRREDMYEWGR